MNREHRSGFLIEYQKADGGVSSRNQYLVYVVIITTCWDLYYYLFWKLQGEI